MTEVLNRPKPGFDGSARVETMPDGQWRFTYPLGYRIESARLRREMAEFQRRFRDDLDFLGYSALNEKMTVLEGFVMDFASVPFRVLWPLIAPTDIRRPAAGHDAWYYELKKLWWAGKLSDEEFVKYRLTADEIFREALPYTEPKVALWKRAAAYRAVRAFGWYDRKMLAEQRRRRRLRLELGRRGRGPRRR